MVDADRIADCLGAVAERADGEMSERDVENLFLEEGFYDALGYEGTGTDLRSEFTLPDDRRPDYITRDTNEAVTAVYEFKTTGRDLAPTGRSCLATWTTSGRSTASSRTASDCGCTAVASSRRS